MELTVYGYHYSVYLRIVRLVLAEKGLTAAHVEVNPFAPDAPNPHPFGRVPMLDHNGFTLYETTAIARYLEEAFPGPALQPSTPEARARMSQAIAITDAYAYWPLVRQVFAHAVVRPAIGEPPDPALIADGMATAPRVLAALDAIAAGGLTLSPHTAPDLAALHLAPMLAAFLQAPGTAPLLAGAPHLQAWWQTMATRPSLAETDPGLP